MFSILFSDDESIWELDSIIKKLHYHNQMDADYLLNYSGEYEESLGILTDEKIIDSFIKNNQADETENDSFAMKHVFRKEVIKEIKTLNNFFLQNEKCIPDILRAL